VYYAYILECGDGSYYTGWTTDLQARLEKHRSGKAAKYTRSHLPVKLKASWAFESRSQAMSFEWQVKRLDRRAKEKLVLQSNTDRRTTCGATGAF
jgi:putative endonuclease